MARVSAPPARLLRAPEVLLRRARGRAAHYADIQNGLFTPPIRIMGGRCAAWPEFEVEELIRAQIAGASADDLRSLVRGLVAARKDLARAGDRIDGRDDSHQQSPGG